MLKKFSTLLIWALASCFAFAGDPNPTFFPLEVPSLPNDDCDLAPPTNFHVEDIGNTWVTLAWTPVVPGVYDHRVKTYLVAGNILVSDIVVPASQNFVTVNGLTPGEHYYSTNNAICPDGTDSKYYVQSAEFIAVISDLIVNGFNPNRTLQPICGINSYLEYCEFPLSGENTYFQVYTLNYPYFSRQFLTFKNVHQTSLIHVKISSTDGFYQFKIDGKTPDEIGVPGTIYQIFANYGATLVATFEIYTHNYPNEEVGRLICTGIDSGYGIVRLGTGNAKSGSPSTYQEDTENREASQKAALSFSANPNPFSETLEVTLGENTQGPIHLQLLNLSGQVVIDRREMPGLEQVTLPTDHLANGFYMLRIEAAGEVQTIKVVKSE